LRLNMDHLEVQQTGSIRRSWQWQTSNDGTSRGCTKHEQYRSST
jgi:hypothetical protein